MTEPTSTPTPSPAPTDFLASATPELRGHAQNHGWDKLPVAEAALKAIQSHREAQQKLGVPQDQLVRLPDVKNADSVKEFWQKLGAPKEAKEYDFTNVKFQDGTALDDKTADFLRTSFLGKNVPKDLASGITTDLVKFLDGLDATEKAEQAAKLTASKEALAKNWGPKLEPNMFIAKQAAAKLSAVVPGLKEAVDALEQHIGMDKVMQLFLVLGTQMGEAKFVANDDGGNGGNPNLMSADQANVRLGDLKKDQAWVTRFLNGDVQAAQEKLALEKIITASKQAPSTVRW